MKSWKHLALIRKFKRRPWVRLTHGHKLDSEVPLSEAAPHFSSQADRVIQKFGGVRDLMRALERLGRPRNAASIYRWTYPYPRGTGGLIPPAAWPDVLLAARSEGILLSATDTQIYADPRVEEAFCPPDALTPLGKQLRRRNAETPPPYEDQVKRGDARRRVTTNRNKYRASEKGKAGVKRHTRARQARIVAARIAVRGKP